MATDPYRKLSVSELLHEVSREGAALVGHTLALAQVEVRDRVAAAGRDAGVLIVGLMVLHTAALVAVAALVLGLIEAGLRPWLATAIVAAVLGAAGAVVVPQRVRSLTGRPIVPVDTLDSIKETATWLKNEVTRA